MLKDRQLNKLRIKILKSIYSYQYRNNEPYSTVILYTSFLNSKYDEHDIDVAINSLIVSKLVSKIDDDLDPLLSLTDKGESFVISNTNKFLQYLKANHLAIIALIISIIALFKP